MTGRGQAMFSKIYKIRQDKKIYRKQMEKVNTLPKDYQFVFEKMSDYIWSFAGGDGMDTLETQYKLIDLFTEAAADGLEVLDVTGKDVAGFCDELIRGNKSWLDSPRKRLNSSIRRQ